MIDLDQPAIRFVLKLVFGALAVLFVSLILVLIFVPYPTEMDQPRALPTLYKGAHEVSQQVVGRGGQSTLPMGLVRFTAPDSPENVHDFYVTTMKAAGWDAYVSDPEEIYFQYDGFDTPRYAVLIKITPAANHESSVEIKIFAGGSDWHGDTLF